VRGIKDCSLYLVVSEEYGRRRASLEIAKAAVSGGIDILQMREKTMPRQELIRLGSRLLGLCRENGVIFIANDDPLLAKELDADGVHLGQEDLERFSVGRARAILGKDRIIGVSTHSVSQFKIANESDVDYIAFGPIFPTKTKDYFLGTAHIKIVVEMAKKPSFFIGGINLSNIDEVLREGAGGIALIRGILEADDIASAARGFKERLKAHLNR